MQTGCVIARSGWASADGAIVVGVSIFDVAVALPAVPAATRLAVHNRWLAVPSFFGISTRNVQESPWKSIFLDIEDNQ